jgi:uncharacterized protein with HEPN domain
MKKDNLVYIRHMLDIARSAVAKVEGIDRSTFEQDENLRLAVVHLIQTVGEAAARVSGEFRTAHADIPWQIIVGMRHRIIHDYIDVNYDLVWGVATIDLPALIPQLEAIVPD